MAYEGNGVYKKLETIEADVRGIKDDLSSSVDRLTIAVDNLSAKFDNFISVAQNSLPIKAVFWLMGIMVLGLVGVEGSKSIAPIIKAWLAIP